MQRILSWMPFYAAITLVAVTSALEATTNMPKLNELKVQNGIHPKDFYGFWKNWKLLTVRYRTDNQEQRFVYANDIAWKAIVSGDTSYPEGAMLGKVGFTLSEDQNFPSSLVPDKVARIQIMRKGNMGKASDHGGWSYWLYSQSADTVEMKDQELSIYCHACHNLVPQQDFTFSSAAFFDNGKVSVVNQLKRSDILSKFLPLSKVGLSPSETSLLETAKLPADSRLLRMPLFEGSLSELVPLLAAHSVSGMSLVVMDGARKSYIAAMPAAKSSPAKPCEHPTLFVKSLPLSQESSASPSASMRYGLLCQGQPLMWSSEDPTTVAK